MDTHVSSNSQSSQSQVHAIRFLALDAIEPSSTSVQQRRRSHYDATALKELAENIKSFQVIEPIVVRPKSAGEGSERFELVAGERRWLASGEAGLKSIPAIVRALDDREVIEIQLIENLHREGLLGREFKSEALLEDTESGRVVEIIKLSEHGEALKAKGVRAEKPSRGSDGERARQKAAKLETRFRERVFGAIRAKTPTAIAGAELRLVACAPWNMAGHDARLRLVTLWNWAEKQKAAEVVYRCEPQIAKLSEADLRRFVVDCALVDEVRANQYDTRKPTKLLDTAKRLRVNLDEIRKALKAEQAAKGRPQTKKSAKTTAKSTRGLSKAAAA